MYDVYIHNPPLTVFPDSCKKLIFLTYEKDVFCGQNVLSFSTVIHCSYGHWVTRLGELMVASSRLTNFMVEFLSPFRSGFIVVTSDESLGERRMFNNWY